MFDGSPVAQAAGVLADALQRFPREEAAALMLADVALARAVGWERSVPILAAHLNRADVRAIADGASDARLRVDQAMIDACDAAIRNAADLSRRAARLNAIAALYAVSSVITSAPASTKSTAGTTTARRTGRLSSTIICRPIDPSFPPSTVRSAMTELYV